ncbi:ATP-binding cassette, subfamily B [Rhodococcus triatomae]|uniref:ATP-binding cassette, subfamily B n=1 Tax=Rhodococcus triatomae TaxID=300028 RepID=A0A1G8GID5_9NOCA|nr:ATP-binding cassette, subfamily B [Rhodococcus triatomae]
MIVIAHRLSTVTGVDSIVVLADGVVDAVGTHEELLAGSDVYRELWRAGEPRAVSAS